MPARFWPGLTIIGTLKPTVTKFCLGLAGVTQGGSAGYSSHWAMLAAASSWLATLTVASPVSSIVNVRRADYLSR